MYTQIEQAQTKHPLSVKKEEQKLYTLNETISQDIRRHYSILAQAVILTSRYRNGIYSSGFSVTDENGTVLEPNFSSDFNELYNLRESICSQYGNGAHTLSPLDCEACPW